MLGKLPADFDPERYRAAHPDVGLSGLTPTQHYLRFGRAMGRSPTGKGATTAGSTAAEPIVAAASENRPAISSQTPGPSDRQTIIDRPESFTATDTVPVPAPAKGDNSGIFTIDSLAVGPFESTEERQRLCRPLAAYARLFSLELPSDDPKEVAVVLCGSDLLRADETKIENAWFAASSVLRLMIAGGQGDTVASGGWALRAYQGFPVDPAQLRMTGQGVQLPLHGPVFHDLELVDPLMPLILELSDANGIVRDTALLPFPSLLPGGLHHAELKALQTEANPIDEFWSLSGILLQELLGDANARGRSIVELGFHPDGADSAANACPDVNSWLSSVFGLPLPPAKGARKGLRLLLPRDAVPTISALVSRRLDHDGIQQLTGPLLIADPSSLRPRWSVVLPSNEEAAPELPALVRLGAKSRAKAAPTAVPIHLAIALRAADAPLDKTRRAPRASPSGSVPVSVVLESSDEARTERIVRSLLQIASGSELQLFVRFSGREGGLPRVLDDLCGAHCWTRTRTPIADPRSVVASAEHELMMTISDRVKLDGPETLSTLIALAREVEDASSVSCVLLGEKIIKKQAVLQPASGGLFPAGVSFASSPRLTFSEPDVLQALPDRTYPVVANTFLATIWRASALTALPPATSPVPPAAADIRLGLDLMAAGYRNLCTSKTRALLSGPYARRNAIDPVGSAYIQPARWEDILGRVTVLRELF